MDLAETDGPTEQSQAVFTLQREVERWEGARKDVETLMPAHDTEAAETWCWSSVGWMQVSL